MKRLIYDTGLVAVFRRDGTWVDGDGKRLDVYDDRSRRIRRRLGPADGFPREAVFYEIAKRSGATKIEDDEEPEDAGDVDY